MTERGGELHFFRLSRPGGWGGGEDHFLSLKAIENFRDHASGKMIFRTFVKNTEKLSYGFVEPYEVLENVISSKFSNFGISKGRMKFGCVDFEGPKYSLLSCKIIF